MLKIYILKNCSSCQKALQFLEAKNLQYQSFSIVDQPPSPKELKKMLGFLKANGQSFKKLFNTSGEQYRLLKISQKLAAGLSEQEALAILATNGKLIKRPFAIDESFGLLGFQPDIWQSHF